MGAESDIIAYLLSRYFGLRAFGTAFGYSFGAFVLAGAIGTLLMGAARRSVDLPTRSIMMVYGSDRNLIVD